MDTKTVVHDGLCVEVGEMRFGDERRFHVIAGKLAELSPTKGGKGKAKPDDYALLLEYDLVKFAYAVAQSRSHAGFNLPAPTDTPKQIMTAFEEVDNLPRKFVAEWFDAAADLRAAVDRELAPPNMLSDTEKKASASVKDA